METEYTNPNITENDTFRRCMNCANACIVEDRDVGIWPYPDDCKAIKGYAPYSRNGVLKLGRGTMPGENFAYMDTNPKFCAWYARQYPLEHERLRCKKCNSPQHRVLEIINDVNIDEETGEAWDVDGALIKCGGCGENSIVELSDLYWVMPEPEGC